MTEEWRGIRGVPGFLISSKGRVRRTDERQIKVECRNGVKRVHLTVNGKSKTFYVENLVRASFGFQCGRGCTPDDRVKPEEQKPCATACECWHCGLNPEVEFERKMDIRQHGLTKDPDGLFRYHVNGDYP